MGIEPTSQPEQFMALFVEHRREICALLAALVPHAADADDVLQETLTRMWRNFERFTPGTDFTAWASAFVRFSVLTHYRKKRAAGLVTFSDELVDAVVREMPSHSSQADVRREALATCLDKLPARLKVLLDLRYEPRATIKSVAEQLGRPIHTVYKEVGRAHELLIRCIEKALPSGGKGRA